MSQTNRLRSSCEDILVQIDEDIREILPELLENCLQDAAAMREALRQGDYKALQTMGHGMKGVGGFGLDQLSTLGMSIEQTAKARDYEGVQKLVDEIVAYVEGLLVID